MARLVDLYIDHIGDAGAADKCRRQLGPKIPIGRLLKGEADIRMHVGPKFVNHILHPFNAVAGEAPKHEIDFFVLGADHANRQRGKAESRQRG